MTYDIFRPCKKLQGQLLAQMATFAVWHPDVEEFIKAKREDGTTVQYVTTNR